MGGAIQVYPDAAKQARVDGTVVLEATVSPEGKVTHVKVLRGDPLLDQAAVDAVQQWATTLLPVHPHAGTGTERRLSRFRVGRAKNWHEGAMGARRCVVCWSGSSSRLA